MDERSKDQDKFFMSLTESELANVRPITAEELRKALADGARDRAAVEQFVQPGATTRHVVCR